MFRLNPVSLSLFLSFPVCLCLHFLDWNDTDGSTTSFYFHFIVNTRTHRHKSLDPVSWRLWNTFWTLSFVFFHSSSPNELSNKESKMQPHNTRITTTQEKIRRQIIRKTKWWWWIGVARRSNGAGCKSIDDCFLCHHHLDAFFCFFFVLFFFLFFQGHQFCQRVRGVKSESYLSRTENEKKKN